MFHRRRFLFSLAAGGCVAGLPGCFPVTSRLFEDRRYSESVSSVLISKDEKKLVFITNDFHYIFDATPAIVSTLKGSFHKSASATLGTLKVDSSGATSIAFRLSLAKQASEAEKQEALKAGYIEGRTGAIYAEGELRGMRYASGGIVSREQPTQLNERYLINVVAPQSSGEQAAKALLTPITVAADGALTITAVASAAAVVVAIPLLIVWFSFTNLRCDDGCKY